MHSNMKNAHISHVHQESAFQAEREVYESTIKQLKRRIGDLERTLLLTNDELMKEKAILEENHRNFSSNSELKRRLNEARELLAKEETNNKGLVAKISAQKEIIDNKNHHILQISELMEELRNEREKVMSEVSLPLNNSVLFCPRSRSSATFSEIQPND